MRYLIIRIALFSGPRLIFHKNQNNIGRTQIEVRSASCTTNSPGMVLSNTGCLPFSIATGPVSKTRRNDCYTLHLITVLLVCSKVIYTEVFTCKFWSDVTLFRIR